MKDDGTSGPAGTWGFYEWDALTHSYVMTAGNRINPIQPIREVTVTNYVTVYTATNYVTVYEPDVRNITHTNEVVNLRDTYGNGAAFGWMCVSLVAVFTAVLIFCTWRIKR